MATRTTVPGTKAGVVPLSATEFNSLPGGWLAHAQVTDFQAGITTGDTALSGLSVTPTLGADRMIRVSGKVQIADAGAPQQVLIYVKDGGTTINRFQTSLAGLTGTARVTCKPEAILDGPSAGPHTFSLSMQVVGSGSADMEADDTYPAHILVEDLGPASV